MRTSLIVVGLGLLGGCLVACQVEDAGEPGSEAPLSDRFGMPCQQPNAASACPVDDETSSEGVQFCYEEDDELIWGECVGIPACDPMQDRCADGSDACVLEGEGTPSARECVAAQGDEPADEPADEPEDEPGNCDECDTPLVLSFSDDPVAFVPAAAGAGFDIAGEGRCDSHDWPAAQTPWLVIDLDGNGKIDGGHELFGSGTVLASGAKADDGFAALAPLDSDGDGAVTEADARFGELMAWSDLDGDKQADAGELEPLSSYGVFALPLSFDREPTCDVRGNCAVEQAALGFSASGSIRTGRLIDVHLPCR